MGNEQKGWAKIAESVEKLAKNAEQASDFNFSAPKSTQKDSQNIKEVLDNQKPKQRTALLVLVGGLCVISFVLLGFIVIWQMAIRIHHPKYLGVSDIVINILTGGIFGQSIAIVAVIAGYVWKDPK